MRNAIPCTNWCIAIVLFVPSLLYIYTIAIRIAFPSVQRCNVAASSSFRCIGNMAEQALLIRMFRCAGAALNMVPHPDCTAEYFSSIIFSRDIHTRLVLKIRKDRLTMNSVQDTSSYPFSFRPFFTFYLFYWFSVRREMAKNNVEDKENLCFARKRGSLKSQKYFKRERKKLVSTFSL